MPSPYNTSLTPHGRVAPDSPYADIIRQAYKVFQRPTPDDDGACDCCMYPEIKRTFFSHGPYDLPLHYLNDWFHAAVDPELPQSLWAWLLPRILETLASGEEVSHVGNEVALSRFPTGDKSQWTKKEWDVIDRFQRLYLDQVQPSGADFLDDVLCMFVKGGWPPKGIFAQVLDWPTERLVTHLHHDWQSAVCGVSIWTTAFWDDDAVPNRFWRAPALSERFLRYALEDTTPTDLCDKALELADCIDRTPPATTPATN